MMLICCFRVAFGLIEENNLHENVNSVALFNRRHDVTPADERPHSVHRFLYHCWTLPVLSVPHQRICLLLSSALSRWLVFVCVSAMAITFGILSATAFTSLWITELRHHLAVVLPDKFR